jgi:hypothetical protein
MDPLNTDSETWKYRGQVVTADELVEVLVGEHRFSPAARGMPIGDSLFQLANVEALTDEEVADEDRFPQARWQAPAWPPNTTTMDPLNTDSVNDADSWERSYVRATWRSQRIEVELIFADAVASLIAAGDPVTPGAVEEIALADLLDR